MFRRVLYPTALVALVCVSGAEVGAQRGKQQQIQPGTIAVFDVGTALQTPEARGALETMRGHIEEAVLKSGRFSDVLPRNAAVEKALQAEMERSMSPASLSSVVRISQENQLNANYVIDGWIENLASKEVDTDNSGGKSKRQYRADLRGRVRIVNVETGSLVFSETFTVNSVNPTVSQTLGKGADGKCKSITCRIREGAGRAAGTLLVNADSPQEAVDNAVRNSLPAIKQLLSDNLGYTVADIVGEGAAAEVLIDASPTLSKGQRFEVSTTQKTARGRNIPKMLGTIEITRVDQQYAYAKIVEGADQIVSVLKNTKDAVTARRTN